ncbi:putative amidophosphoribosyltransferase [Nocardioides albertanoniae]|uniref:Putative amidophosphoribosyltransferase n=1 Tax=Nocardioides albertanoniae TaxID=1175486 RepID=A0A543A402_9ACTN|nr:ComF family protein [Nocardioides albertanoniae]TQL67307.1 putative amidophosphoribosyltransferase [Nocardioides albertanoniae]
MTNRLGLRALELADAWHDLVVGGSCIGCRRPGRLLCRECRAALPTQARSRPPAPAPTGIVPVFAAGPYEGLLKELVIGLKEHQLLALRTPLAGLLALSVLEAMVATGGDPSGDPDATTILVPVPSRPASVRERGLDSTSAITRGAAALLRRQGVGVRHHRLLRTRPGVADQAGLDFRQRQANLDGSITCPASGIRTLARTTPRAGFIVCDDVITTGATARDAQRALESAGLRVKGIATVAATQRRSRVQTEETIM